MVMHQAVNLQDKGSNPFSPAKIMKNIYYYNNRQLGSLEELLKLQLRSKKMSTKKFNSGDYVIIYEDWNGVVHSAKVVYVDSLSELNDALLEFIEEEGLEEEPADNIIVRKLGDSLTVKKEGFTVSDC